MTTPDDNPYAPPAYPPPEGPMFALPPEGPTSTPSPEAGRTQDRGVAESNEAVTQAISGPVTESVRAPFPPTSRLAKRAFVLGALSLLLTPIAGIAAVVIGRRARDEISKTGEGGAGLARAGSWMGGVFSLVWLFAVAFLTAVEVGSVAS